MKTPKFKWLKRRRKADPESPYESPIWLGNMSNGEFFRPATEKHRKMRDLILRQCDDNARKLGMERREFIASSMGMATALSVLNLGAGCGGKNGTMSQGAVDKFMNAGASGANDGGIAAAMSGKSGSGSTMPPRMTSDAGLPRGAGAPGSGGAGGIDPNNMRQPMPSSMGGGSDGGFMVSQDMCMNAQMADALFKTDYFILDFQTHHTNEGQGGPVLDDCMDGAACTDPNTYVQKIFEMSDTTVAVLSGLPAAIDEMTNDLAGPFAFTNEAMRKSRDRVNMAARMFNPMAGERMIAHCQISPKNNPEGNARMMAENKMMHDTRGWKCYPPTEGGWFLHENDAFIKTAIELDEPLVCLHKGFPFPMWSRVHADPMPDVGRVALMYPNVNFVVYHSAYDADVVEGPYNPNPDPDRGGTDRLWKVVTDNELAGKNVYAEMGSAWVLSMSDPAVAQHYIGKALKYMGPDRVVWGSECVWFGCPQNQIEAMKAFQISTEYQDMYGYPEYTVEVRRKVFGLNGAPLYRIDPEACRYKVSVSELASYRKQMDEDWGPRRHMLHAKPAITTRRSYWESWKNRIAQGDFG